MDKLPCCICVNFAFIIYISCPPYLIHTFPCHIFLLCHSLYHHLHLFLPLHISWTYVSLSINSSCQSSSLFHFLQYSFPSSYVDKLSCCVCFFSFLLSCSHPFHTSFVHYPATSCYPCSFILSSSSPPLPIPTPSYSYTHFPSFHLNHLHLHLSFI